MALIEVELKTGRHHQIRVQLAHQGYPIWGDVKYNEHFQNKRGWTQIALFAYYMSFKHPKTNKTVTYIETPLNMEPFNKFKTQLK